MQDHRTAFGIQLVGERVLKAGLVVETPRLAIECLVQIAGSQETYYCPLDRWGEREYRAQWISACEGLASGAARARFVISMHPAAIVRVAQCLTVWRLADGYCIHEGVAESDIDWLDSVVVARGVSEHSDVTPGGDRIRPWRLPLDVKWRWQDGAIQ